MGIKKNFDGLTIKRPNGSEILNPVIGADGKPVTKIVQDDAGNQTVVLETKPQSMADMIVDVLEEVTPRPQGARPLSIEEKRLRRKISKKIVEGGEQEYEPKERDMIVDACAESLVTLPFGQIDEFVNN